MSPRMQGVQSAVGGFTCWQWLAVTLSKIAQRSAGLTNASGKYNGAVAGAPADVWRSKLGKRAEHAERKRVDRLVL